MIGIEHPLLSDPRWSLKCGWMESCELCVVSPRRRLAKMWSSLWPRPLVSVSNSLYHSITLCQAVVIHFVCVLKVILKPQVLDLKKAWRNYCKQYFVQGCT